MEIVAIVLVAWLAVAFGVVSLCWAAARGDAAQIDPGNRRRQQARRPNCAPVGARTTARLTHRTRA